MSGRLAGVLGRLRALAGTGLARLVGVLVLFGALTALATAAPRWLRRADAFRVRRVDVVGTRYLEPHAVLAASGIGRSASVFDDPAPWRARVLRLPMITDATVERRLPSSLVIRVVEAEPVALAATPDLVPVDARGAVLPIPPGSADLDLPVLVVDARVGADGRLATP
ncbi:MAG TPA: FtsQ-type POTRA domain-containing protein, partial [Longimicrobiales bacterium]